MPEFTGTTADGNDLLSTCPSFCQGHCDPGTYGTHSSDLDFFGKDGPVVVTQTDGELPKVSLVDLPHPQVDFTPAHARVLAYQILNAADVAERAAQPSPSVIAELTRMLAEALASSGH